VVDIAGPALSPQAQDEYLPGAGAGGKPAEGVGGTHLFRFEAVSAGQSTTRPVYYRVSGKDVDPLMMVLL
jgi:hypothetical protein